MKKIVLTGGGTAGHVTPNIALMPKLRELGYDIEYIGSYTGIEKTLIEGEGIPYHGISSGKLRRYRDIKNLTDPFRVMRGFFQSLSLLRRIKPQIVFSKGGFVSVPVVIAAHLLHIPAVIHESDMTPGLANKLCFKSASAVCCNFPETVKYLPDGKGRCTGSPIRSELFTGSKEAAREFTGFTDDKPVLTIIGGSLGSVAVNNAVRSCLPRLSERFNIIHLCGKGNLDESLNTEETRKYYVQYEYIAKELKDLFALTDILVSRAGANAICEIAALHKPNVLIPLSAAASRGDQILNARSFEAQGFSRVLLEEDVTDDSLYNAVIETYDNRDKYIDAMASSPQSSGVDNIISAILAFSAGSD